MTGPPFGCLWIYDERVLAPTGVIDAASKITLVPVNGARMGRFPANF